MNLYDIIERIRECPSLYLGAKKISLLKAFLDGYRACQLDNGIIYQPKYMLFPLDFALMHEFVGARLKNSSVAGWKNIILQYCEGDEEKSIDKFYELFDEFKSLRMKKGWRIQLNNANINWHNSMRHNYTLTLEGKKPLFENPLSLCVVELTDNAGYLFLIETRNSICSRAGFIPTAEEALQEAESCFGRVKGWKEISDGENNNIEFGKPLHI